MLCPEGWHVPTDEEWKSLEIYLGIDASVVDTTGLDGRGENEASKLASNSELWNDGTLEEDSESGRSGFDALPGGYRALSGGFADVEGWGDWWTSTIDSSTSSALAFDRRITYSSPKVVRATAIVGAAHSVRCIKD